MKTTLFAAASALALVVTTSPAVAQMNMPGMHMPGTKMPTTQKRAAAKENIAPARKGARAHAKASVKKPSAKKTSGKPQVHRSTSAVPTGQAMPGMAMPEGQAVPGALQAQNMPGITMPMPSAPQAGGAQMPMDDQHMDKKAGMEMGHGEQMAMTGALGSYPVDRESSGTAWQPDSSQHTGFQVMSGGWMLMAHGDLNFVYDHQSGPRGDDKAFASGMLMGMASRPIGNGKLQFKAMLSPDPLMGPSGYPLLLASGETANGRDRLIDRQHPHDFFMELSGSVSQNIGKNSSVFVYGGLPGEPAFGPPAFMHREAIMDSPEAPISHHWLDSTHIAFGVLTAGVILDRVKVEVSRFNAREPDQHRWDIETGPLDSTSVRLSWNLVRTLSLQGSWAYFKDPEQLEPGVNQKRLSASVLWAADIAPGWHAATTLAWGRKSSQGHNDNAYVAEASLKHSQWTLFGRAEETKNRELIERADGPAYYVGKFSLGAIRDLRLAEHLKLGVGGLFSVNFVPRALAPLYGAHNPTGAMGFVRVKLD